MLNIFWASMAWLQFRPCSMKTTRLAKLLQSYLSLPKMILNLAVQGFYKHDNCAHLFSGLIFMLYKTCDNSSYKHLSTNSELPAVIHLILIPPLCNCFKALSDCRMCVFPIPWYSNSDYMTDKTYVFLFLCHWKTNWWNLVRLLNQIAQISNQIT